MAAAAKHLSDRLVKCTCQTGSHALERLATRCSSDWRPDTCRHAYARLAVAESTKRSMRLALAAFVRLAVVHLSDGQPGAYQIVRRRKQKESTKACAGRI